MHLYLKEVKLNILV